MSENVANQIEKSGNDASDAIVNNCAELAEELMTKSTNLVNKVGQGKIGTPAVMNPSNPDSIPSKVNKMISNSARDAKLIRQEAKSQSQNIRSNSAIKSSELRKKGESTSDKILDFVEGMATGFLGEVGTSLVKDILNGGDGSTVPMDNLGGSFGLAKQQVTPQIDPSTGQPLPVSVEQKKSTLGELMGGITSGLGNLSKGLVGGVGDVVGGLLGVGESGVSSIVNCVTDIGKSLFGGGGEQKGAAENTSDNMLNTSTDVGSSLVNALPSIASTALDVLGFPGLGGLAGLAVDAASKLDWGNLMPDSISDFASGVADTIGEMTNGFVDSASSLADSVMDFASDSLDALSDICGEDLGGFLDDCTDSLDGISDMISDMINEWFADGMNNEELDALEYEDDYEDDDDWDGDLDGDGIPDVKVEVEFPEDEDEEDEDDDDWEEDDEDGESGEDGQPAEQEPSSDDNATQNVQFQGSDASIDNTFATTKSDREVKSGWNGAKLDVVDGLESLMHDGD